MESKFTITNTELTTDRIVHLTHELSRLRATQVVLNKQLTSVKDMIDQCISELNKLKYKPELLLPGMCLKFTDDDGLHIDTVIATKGKHYDLIVTSDIREFYPISQYAMLDINKCENVSELINRVSLDYNWKLYSISDGLRK